MPIHLDSILVANRGEIAVRILRTACSLGYRTVAVYSDADAGAPHVELADEAVRLGPAPAAESYLSIPRLLEAARASGARAIHPGYGFLAENADFARACVGAGLVFIGPGADAIERMGNKAEAKRLMLEAGVPCVPGFHQRAASDEQLIAAAKEVGFPLMVKAAAGGGGRGLRLVREPGALPGAIARARSEAQAAFGSDELILERAIARPRHVEIQILADAHGQVIHLGERDCSVQRRHQKVIEESPSPALTPALRARMGEAAVAAAHSIGYLGAGTVELLLDEDGAFFFLEMNTRLQVEHPVTELVTGLDLVALQIQVAEGRPLELRQEDVRLEGHAIEARLYAEDPAQDFLPVAGRVELWRPSEREGLRVDAGVRTGLEISPYYDPLVAKLIAWAPTRDQARRRLVQGLADTALFGPANNRGFLIQCLEAETMAAGEATTAFLDEVAIPPADPEHERELPLAAAVLQHLAARDAAHAAALMVSSELLDWGSSEAPRTRVRYEHGGGEIELVVRPLGAGRYRVEGGGVEGGGVEVAVLERAAPVAELRIAGRRRRVLWHAPDRARIHLALASATASLDDLLQRVGAAEEDGGGGRVTAPMHGSVVAVLVAPGDAVVAGARLVVVEAMKMQHELVARVDGVVAAVAVTAGQQVAAGDLLIEIDVEQAAEPAAGAVTEDA
ncbi:MAG TPA: biotin carboxylase N-terminal domain-containing protein [Thermoanaerobaculia bacterium]|nr:biotin carboxylase N-terminal domain-containing protein [Thermoanaerobaculia bacterium]